MKGENRKFYRFDCMLSGKARLQNRSIACTRIKNFSRKGLLMNLPDSEEKLNDEIEMSLDIPGKPLSAYICGKVIWKKRAENHTDVGISITQIDSIRKSEIMDYVYSVWKERKKKKLLGLSQENCTYHS